MTGVIKLIVFIVSFTSLLLTIACGVTGGQNEKEPARIELQINTQNDDIALRDSIGFFAESLLGTPYVYGSCTKNGFDCSGFVYYVFSQFDIDVPRSSAQYDTFGQEIPIEQVKKGDILVFLSPSRNAIGHVGIVLKANGQESEFIHATSGKAKRVVVTSLTNEGYTRRFVKAIKVME